MYSAIAIGLLVGITILSVCVCVCVWCHGVYGSVKKDKGHARIQNTDTCTQFLHKDFPRVYMSRSGASYYKTYCDWNLIDT